MGPTHPAESITGRFQKTLPIGGPFGYAVSTDEPIRPTADGRLAVNRPVLYVGIASARPPAGSDEPRTVGWIGGKDYAQIKTGTGAV